MDAKKEAYRVLVATSLIEDVALVNLMTGEVIAPEIDYEAAEGSRLKGFLNATLPVGKVWDFKNHTYKVPVLGFGAWAWAEAAQGLGDAEAKRLDYTRFDELFEHMQGSKFPDYWGVDDTRSLKELSEIICAALPAMAA